MTGEKYICPRTDTCLRYGAIGADCDHRKPHDRWNGCGRESTSMAHLVYCPDCIPLGLVTVFEERSPEPEPTA